MTAPGQWFASRRVIVTVSCASSATKCVLEMRAEHSGQKERSRAVYTIIAP